MSFVFLYLFYEVYEAMAVRAYRSILWLNTLGASCYYSLAKTKTGSAEPDEQKEINSK